MPSEHEAFWLPHRSAG